MRNFSGKSVAAMAVFALTTGVMSSAVQAGIYPLDTFLFSENLGNSGNETEEQALEDYLGMDVAFGSKVNNASVLAVSNGAGEWYLDVAPDSPGYFLLKFGVGNSGLDDTYYFQNIADVTKLVWSDAQVNFITGGSCGIGGSDDACNIGRLSHYTTFNDVSSSSSSGGASSSSSSGGASSSGDVPEPNSGTMALLGLGLLAGTFAWRRRSLGL